MCPTSDGDPPGKTPLRQPLRNNRGRGRGRGTSAPRASGRPPPGSSARPPAPGGRGFSLALSALPRYPVMLQPASTPLAPPPMAPPPMLPLAPVPLQHVSPQPPPPGIEPSSSSPPPPPANRTPTPRPPLSPPYLVGMTLPMATTTDVTQENRDQLLTPPFQSKMVPLINTTGSVPPPVPPPAHLYSNIPTVGFFPQNAHVPFMPSPLLAPMPPMPPYPQKALLLGESTQFELPLHISDDLISCRQQPSFHCTIINVPPNKDGLCHAKAATVARTGEPLQLSQAMLCYAHTHFCQSELEDHIFLHNRDNNTYTISLKVGVPMDWESILKTKEYNQICTQKSFSSFCQCKEQMRAAEARRRVMGNLKSLNFNEMVHPTSNVLFTCPPYLENPLQTPRVQWSIDSETIFYNQTDLVGFAARYPPNLFPANSTLPSTSNTGCSTSNTNSNT